MSFRLASLLASSLLVTAQFAIAQEAAPEAAAPATASTAAESSAEDEITCEREAITGSRVKKRLVCMSDRQRKQERELTSQALGGLRSNQTSSGN